MAYVKKEEMDKFIDIMYENDLTPIMLLGPYLEKKYENKERNPRLQTSAQIMKTLGISKSTLYRYMEEGLPYETKDGGRGRVFDKELCIAYIKQYKALKKKERKIKNEKI